MRIEKLRIDGFGIFSDFHLDNLSGGLIVVQGDNEAGKSTLMAFVRQALYGFPRKGQKDRRQYPPVRGGRHGGSITLRMKNGAVITVIRHEGPQGGTCTVRDSDGNVVEPGRFPGVLDVSREELYRTIFAFSLDELQNFKTLDNTRINDIIYSASMGAGGKNLVEINRKLTGEMTGFFKPRGSKQKINELLKAIEDNHSRLKECQSSINEFDRVHAALEEKERELSDVEGELTELQEELGESRLLLDALEDWMALQVLQRERAELPVNRALTGMESLLNELYKETGDYNKAKRDLPQLTIERQALEQARDGLLAEIGPDWDVEKMKVADTSVQMREIVRGFKEKLERADEALKEADRAFRQAQKTLQELTAKREAAENDAKQLTEQRAGGSGQDMLPLRFAYVIFGVAAAVAAPSIIFRSIAGLVVAAMLGLAGCAYFWLRKRIGRTLYERELQQKRNAVQSLAAEVTRVLKECEELEAEIKEKSAARERTGKEWSALLREYSLREGLSPESVIDIIANIRDAKNKHADIESLDERIAKIDKTIQGYETAARELAEKSGGDFPENMPADKLVEALHSLLEEHRERTRREDDHKNNIRKMAGSEKWIAWLEQNLPSADKIELERTCNELTETIKRQEDKKVSLHKEIAVLNREKDDLERRTDTAAALGEREILITELNASAREWAVRRIAKALLDRARERFEKERQPAILKEAARHFENITGGKYTHIYQPLDGGMYIADDYGARKNVASELSRGTAEELYLAVRLGLISSISRDAEPLPVIMDDIFANMDDNRAPAAIRSLSSLMETNQVLIFTCHSQTAGWIKDEYRDARIVALADGAVIPG